MDYPASILDVQFAVQEQLCSVEHFVEISRNLAEELFVLVTLGDERHAVAPYVLGQQAAQPGA